MLLLLLRLLLTIGVAALAGKLISKIKLPSILGWLITGMVLGPHALSLMSQEILDAAWYQTIVHVLECGVGLMIGTELVWNKIKRSGKAIVITTLTQSLGTFAVVSLVFGIVFSITGIPLYLAFIFGGIALATAPAPALSIVREFKTTGPVTQTLVPMAALDDIVGCVVFFITIAAVASSLSAGTLPACMSVLVIVLPLLIGIAMGFVAGFVLKKERSKQATLALLLGLIAATSAVGFVFNNLVLPSPILNFMLIGMAFSATFANMLPETRLEQIMESFSPVLGVAMIVVILNLGAPLDYHLILGAGLFTVIYILARAAGKYFGAYFGASITRSPETVKKYLGLTLLPHSGVSLVFTGIDKIFLQQVQVIRDLAAKGSCVIVGRCADAILADQAHILRVFVCADADTREAAGGRSPKRSPNSWAFPSMTGRSSSWRQKAATSTSAFSRTAKPRTPAICCTGFPTMFISHSPSRSPCCPAPPPTVPRSSRGPSRRLPSSMKSLP